MVLGILTVGNLALARGEGDRFVLGSLRALLTLRTIECDIRIETFVDGKRYTAHGRYEEQVLPHATSETFLRSMYRLVINFLPHSPTASDSEPNRMILVCRASEDGSIHQLERYISIEGNQSFSMIDLKRLETRLKEAQRQLFFTQASEVRNLGGLAGKMRQISRFYEFSLPTQGDLQDGEGVIPVLKLTGTLRGVYRRELLEQFGGLNRRGNYPRDFPSDIEIWLGQHDDFPYKIRYLRRVSENSEQKQPLYQELFHHVKLNGTPLPAATFDPLSREGAVMSDETDNFLWTLGL